MTRSFFCDTIAIHEESVLSPLSVSLSSTAFVRDTTRGHRTGSRKQTRPAIKVGPLLALYVCGSRKVLQDIKGFELHLLKCSNAGHKGFQD